MAKLKKVKCPSCGEDVELDEWLESGDYIACPECDSELEIVSVTPPKVNVVEIRSEGGDYFVERDEEGDGADTEDSA